MTQFSLRTRLVIGILLLVTLGLAVATGTGIVLLRSYLMDRVDDQVAELAPMPPPGVTADPCANPRDPRGLRSDFVFIVVDSEGSVVCSLGPAWEEAGPDFNRVTVSSERDLMTVPSVDGSAPWRMLASTSRGYTTITAVSLADTEATVDRLVQVSLIVDGAVLVLTGLAAWVIAGVGLSPLRRIEDTAAQIADGDLSQRVPQGPPGTEIGRLGTSLNGMLGQIEEAFTARAESETRLRRFVQDASHELRTPVAAIRGHAEMWRTGVTRDVDSLMSRIESQTLRMGDLVDDMLLLARLDQDRPLERESVDLLSVVTDVVIDARAVQSGRTIRLEATPGPVPPVVTGDAVRLRQVVANLVGNALHHTPESAEVRVGVTTTASCVQIEVRDAGPGMPAEVVNKVFDRFYRAHAGRSRDHGGSGLGLSIVRSTTEAHGGTVICDNVVGEGTVFRVQLPLSP